MMNYGRKKIFGGDFLQGNIPEMAWPELRKPHFKLGTR
jgi:hypothetical protein